MRTHRISYVVDKSGNIQAVQLSEDLWNRVSEYVLQKEKALHSQESGVLRPEPMEAFEEMLACWDFPYPYSPAVTCPHCQSQTDDWRSAEGHPFHLLNANFGGLVALRCKKCGALVRFKHFKDHVAVECDAPE